MDMETKNQESSLSFGIGDPAVWVYMFTFIYVAVLPMAGTMALRNVAMLVLLLFTAWSLPKIRGDFRFGLPVVLWAGYLIVFPLIADDHLIAWQSFGSEWVKGLLAMLAGTGAAALFGYKKRSMVFYLGLASALPIIVHLILFTFKIWDAGTIPWGYWGREVHHADLGYAAGHTVVLMTAVFFAGDKKFRPWAITFIVAALLSAALARSRAGLAFAILGVLLVVVSFYATRPISHRRRFLTSLIVITLAFTAILTAAFTDDSRWHDMTTKLSAGFLGHALTIECEGTAAVEKEIAEKIRIQENANEVTSSVRGGDGARMVLMRAGLELVLQHPWGSDGSRQAYQKLLLQVCENPAILMAHTHNGWIDTLLAIGWGGAILYLVVLLYFLWLGLTGLGEKSISNEWALVLTSLSIFWILRGLVDSVFRDHMLEMQGFMLTYAATAWKLQLKGNARYLDSPQLSTYTSGDSRG